MMIGYSFLLSAIIVVAVPITAFAAESTPFDVAVPVDGTDLAAVTARADTSLLIRAQNTATVANNTISGPTQTGTINFDTQAFQNLNGLSLLSANTGNNVSINSSLNVNVAIQR